MGQHYLCISLGASAILFHFPSQRMLLCSKVLPGRKEALNVALHYPDPSSSWVHAAIVQRGKVETVVRWRVNSQWKTQDETQTHYSFPLGRPMHHLRYNWRFSCLLVGNQNQESSLEKDIWAWAHLIRHITLGALFPMKNVIAAGLRGDLANQGNAFFSLSDTLCLLKNICSVTAWVLTELVSCASVPLASSLDNILALRIFIKSSSVSKRVPSIV